jgi:glycerol-3-phosphate acyltransferase PlsY
MSLGSIAGSLAALVASLGGYLTGTLPFGPLPFVVAGCLLVVGAHADNLRRLRAGTERRFGQRHEQHFR